MEHFGSTEMVGDAHPTLLPGGGVGVGTAALVLLAVVGCSVRPTTFEIVEYREFGQPKRYGETFEEAYYDLNEQGDLDIVLRSSAPGQSDPDQTITQVIHIRSFWRSIPGVTVAHGTQINGTVRYCLISGQRGTTLEGAGSVFFKENRRKNRLTGSLDLASLQPRRRLTGASPIFQRAELKGRFRARRDPRQVVRIINEMDRLFGPRPPQTGRAGR